MATASCVGGVALGRAVARPEFLGRGKLVERDFAFDGAARAGAVVFEEGVAVGAVGEGHVEDLGVFERLLHAGADGVVVVLGFDDGDRDVRLVEEDVVGLLRFAAFDRLAANDDAALGEVDLLPDLGHHVPLAAVRADERGRDELGADVRFGEFLLVHPARSSGYKLAWLEIFRTVNFDQMAPDAQGLDSGPEVGANFSYITASGGFRARGRRGADKGERMKDKSRDRDSCSSAESIRGREPEHWMTAAYLPALNSASKGRSMRKRLIPKMLNPTTCP